MKKKKILLFVLIIVLIYAGGGIAYVLINRKSPSIKISNLDTIKGYDYVLKSNATELYKTEFKSMKSNLEQKSVNEEEYIRSLAKLYIIDLYTLSNKVNKYEVETIYIYPDYESNFKLNVQNTLYKYMEDDSNDNRNQELPEVATIEVLSVEQTKFKYGDEEMDAYEVELSWAYVKDLGYDQKCKVIMVKKDNKYYVVEQNLVDKVDE